MHVGSELKAARKKAGLSVEVMSKRTKINVTRLVALEKNDFKNLPTGLYLFSTVRAYAREVHINPEPIVERLRAEFADQDALDALHALDATGALDAKHLTNPRRSRDARSKALRYGAIAAGVVLIAAAGAGGYLSDIGRIAHDVAASLSSLPRATTIAAAIDVPRQPARIGRQPQTAAVVPGLQEPAAIVGAVPEAPADTPARTEEHTPETPATATTP